ncbi:unnamed protein product [Cunninghamella echinulata]
MKLNGIVNPRIDVEPRTYRIDYTEWVNGTTNDVTNNSFSQLALAATIFPLRLVKVQGQVDWDL